MDAEAADTSASFGPTCDAGSLSAGFVVHPTTDPATISRPRLGATPTIRSQIEAAERGATPLASGTAVATYTPAQIRAAYSFARAARDGVRH